MALLVFAAGLALAACGSSSSGSSTSASGSNAAATGTTTSSSTSTTGRPGGLSAGLTTAQRSCLKSHGVSLPTGVGSRRGGFGGASGTFTTPDGGTFTGPPGGTPPGGGSAGAGFGGGGGGFPGGANPTKLQSAFKACGITFPKGNFAPGAGAARAGGGISSTAIKAFVACVRKHGYDLTGVNTSGKGAVLPRRLQTNKKFLAAARDCTSLLRASGTTTSAGAGG